MIRFVSVLVFLPMALSVSALGQTIDPVGFCPSTTVPTNANALCSTATGLAGETISVGATSFYMYKNGQGGAAINPWYLLLAIPNYSGSAPTLTSPFTQNSVTDVGQFTTGSLYT